VTTEPETATTAVSQSSPATERYSGFNELRTAHLDLRASLPDLVRPGPGPSAAIKLRQFLAMAQRTGAVLIDPSVRKAAQGILDYWCAELAGLSDATKEDFIPLTLAPAAISTLPDIEQAAGKDGETTQRKEDQRVLIRLSGMARQWRNASKQPGYLLTGEALNQAHQFAQQDPDLLEFVEASEAAEAARKKAIDDERRRKRNVAIALIAATASVAVFLYWQFYTLPQTSRAWIRQIKETTSSETQTTNLWWLATFQPWTPPYDFSGTRKLANISFPGLRLYAPNFSLTALSRVSFQNAQLPSASFNRSSIHIEHEATAKSGDGNGFKWNDINSWFRTPVDWKEVRWNEFSGAELKLSQFRQAQIFQTSFAGADLYRAVFDRSVLCDVNFSNADLLNASFWGATIDDRTYGWLRKTAWWLAVGWSSGDYQKLLRPQGQDHSDPQSPSLYPPTDPADARALRLALRKSERFHTDVEIPITESRPGTFDRAMALNEMSWTLTTWGIDQEDLKPNPAPCNSSPQPTDALDAARQAICIIEDLKRKGGPDKEYDYWLANFRDTQAYILMQVNRMPEARALYEKDMTLTEADPGMLFRYAVTLYATNDANGAESRFETAIRQMQYLPGTELQNLKQYIPLKILRMAYDAMDAAYPAPKLNRSCPAEPN
jgi:hypothetical protein